MKTKILLPILVVPFLAGCHIHIGNNYTYNDSDKYIKYTSELTFSEKIENLEINYVSGSVTITKGTEFKVTEEQNEYPCYYWNDLSSKKLTIQYVESGLDLDNKDFSKKNLTVTVPYDLKSLKLDFISCDYSATAFNVDDLDINVVSGDGVVSLEGNKRTFFDSVSGSLNLSISSTLSEERISADMVSGDVTLNLDQKRGFNVNFQKTSGTLTNNFGEATDPTLSKYNINIDTVSGDATINKLG